MIIPSIDLMDAEAVQLVGGRERALDAGDPVPIALRFSLAGEIAVVDLDAALGQGENRAVVERLCRIAPCRVGGGIRDVEAARHWLDFGARRIVLGTAANPTLLRELPRERLIAALDAVDGEVVVDGWREKTGRKIEERMVELRDLVGGFLVTFVEREGRLGGTAMDRVAPLLEAAGRARLTVAGGITTAEEIAELDKMGVDAQVGMALYTDKLDLGDAIAAPLRGRSRPADPKSGRPELWPTVVVDAQGRALGLAWSSRESVAEAVRRRAGVYWSRSRGLWIKGETSGATQRLLRVDHDCDRDALRFVVEQQPPGFCHLGTESCWGDLEGLGALARRIAHRVHADDGVSYTRRLLGDSLLLRSKLVEEAGELADATEPAHVAAEAADLLYFLLVALERSKVSLGDVELELERRALKVTRRPGDAKPSGTVPPGGLESWSSMVLPSLPPDAALGFEAELPEPPSGMVPKRTDEDE